MNYREEQWLLQTTKENNRMLKYIVGFINRTIAKADNENMEDFGRNILANMVSTQFELRQNRK